MLIKENPYNSLS